MIERARFACYAAIVAVLDSGHPRRVQAALAIERVAEGYKGDNRESDADPGMKTTNPER